jgi:hypothetical protein
VMCCWHLPCVLAFPAGGKSLVADVLMLSRLHGTQQALLAKAGPHRGHKPQQKPVTRALIVLPYLSIGKHSHSYARITVTVSVTWFRPEP